MKDIFRFMENMALYHQLSRCSKNMESWNLTKFFRPIFSVLFFSTLCFESPPIFWKLFEYNSSVHSYMTTTVVVCDNYFDVGQNLPWCWWEIQTLFPSPAVWGEIFLMLLRRSHEFGWNFFGFSVLFVDLPQIHTFFIRNHFIRNWY